MLKGTILGQTRNDVHCMLGITKELVVYRYYLGKEKTMSGRTRAGPRRSSTNYS